MDQEEGYLLSDIGVALLYFITLLNTGSQPQTEI